MRDAIAGEKQGTEAGGEREVGDRGDVVVGEIDGVMVLRIGLDGSFDMCELRGNICID